MRAIGICAFLIFFSACNKAELVETQDVNCSIKNDIHNTSNKSTNYQAIIDKYVKLGLPGISVMIQDSSGVWVGTAGYADIDQQVKYNPCHISKVASLTKLMMGTLTFKLQEQGKINIDDPLSKYIDASILKKIDKAEGKTIRQCMNHTTGIYDVITGNDFYLAVLNNPNKHWTQLELLSYVYGKKGYELSPNPAHYSNTNTVLLSMCIEKATGVEHSKLLRELIFDPYGMKSTFYQGHEPILAYAAQGYFDLHNNGSIVNVSNLITGSGNGFGGVFSNTLDLFNFHKALLVDKTILSQTSLDEMQTFVKADEDFYTGLGMIKKFTTKKDFGVGHTGRDLGYSADLFYFAKSNSIMTFFVNYGTNGKSSLKQVFMDFESELVDELLK